MDSLQAPKTGRSRFSKALPAPPSFLDRKNSKSKSKSDLPSLPPSLPSLPPQLPPLSLGLPSSPAPSAASAPRSRIESPRPWLAGEKLLPPINTGPPLPPPKPLVREASAMAATGSPRPLDSPLPRLPLMSIPRRPVGVPAHSVSVASPTSPAPAPAPAIISTLAPPEVASAPAPALSTAPPSPAGSSGSYSSLLSAYSNHSSETTPRSSTNSANDLSSAKDSHSTVSPGQEVSAGSAKSEGPATGFSEASPARYAPEQELGGLRTTAEDKEELPPPPPLKDTVHRTPTPPVERRSPDHLPAATQSPSTLVNSTSQPDQLWRRRSVRSEKNLAVPELRLAVSHGSTAASSQNEPQPEPSSAGPQPPASLSQDQADSASPAAKSRLPLPRSANAALPGRNIRPVASQQVPAPQQDTMGQKASNIVSGVVGRHARNGSPVRLSEKEKPLAPQASPSFVKPMKSLPNIVPPATVVRLPTPEYDSNDFKGPLVETVVSPVSPASSPDLPAESQSYVTRKAVGEGSSQVRHAKSTPTLVPKTSPPALPSPSSGGLSASPAVSRAPGAFPARTTSKLGGSSPLVGRREPAGPSNSFPKQRDQQPRPIPSVTRTISEAGSTASDETVKPKFAAPGAVHNNGSETPLSPRLDTAEIEESDMTDNPGAALFPRYWYTPMPASEVLDARPLERKHFQCLTSHRYMTAARQRVNPIACRICKSKERYAECYICSACHLNICPGCNVKLRRSRGNLEQVLQQIQDQESETKYKPQATKEMPRPDSETFAVPQTDPPLTFVIEAQ